MNITYRLKNIKTYTLIEARLTGPVKNDDWMVFFNQVVAEANHAERLYMLIDEKYYESEINYQTAKSLLQKASKAPIKKFIMSFSTSDPMKMQMQRLYRAMAEVANVPVTISYHLSLNEARNVIRNVCQSCYAKAISLVKK
ncbi:MAG: NAD(P)-dependent oxidoreductase [Alphaproteobacteria bacterium]|nr:NAD(P)-dependent oxidoreductase [Alphaproteobacteria bacterium]